MGRVIKTRNRLRTVLRDVRAIYAGLDSYAERIEPEITEEESKAINSILYKLDRAAAGVLKRKSVQAVVAIPNKPSGMRVRSQVLKRKSVQAVVAIPNKPSGTVAEWQIHEPRLRR